MADQYKVVCGTCKVEPEIVSEADGEAAICPSCGQRDKVEDAIRIAEEQVTDSTTRALQDAVRSAVRSNEFLNFEAEPLPRRNFKWHGASA